MPSPASVVARRRIYRRPCALSYQSNQGMARPLRLEFAGALYHINVFQGRYKAILVEKESYLLELARYIVLNSVRAQMVHTAVEPWSRHARRALGNADVFIANVLIACI